MNSVLRQSCTESLPSVSRLEATLPRVPWDQADCDSDSDVSCEAPPPQIAIDIILLAPVKYQAEAKTPVRLGFTVT